MKFEGKKQSKIRIPLEARGPLIRNNAKRKEGEKVP